MHHAVSPQQAAVMHRLAACRTAALGGHVDACPPCGYTRISYNSCRDRHCPKCQGVKRAEWLENRLERLLPVHHFHLVFTLPKQLNPLMLRNPVLLYDLLFQAASQAVLTLAADPKRLGAQVGLTAILHTWGQNLMFHPHLHCVVTGGGLSLDGRQWIATQPDFFLPVKVLGRLFRGLFLAKLKDFSQAGRLRLAGSAAVLTDPRRFRRWLNDLYRRNWIVYAKRPFGGAEQVFRYLGRYSHRVAIANSRLVAMTDGYVDFQWKDYADENRPKIMRLNAEEFLRRFLLHVLPRRFVRIRHYGLLASRNVPTKLAQCRQLLEATPQRTASAAVIPKTWSQRMEEWTGENPRRCPHCHGPLTRRPLETVTVKPSVPERSLAVPTVNSS